MTGLSFANDALSSFLVVYAALFPIVNPLGCAPIFLSLTRRVPRPTRHVLARRIAVNGVLLLLGSIVVGSHVLEFFGITLPVVRVAGGLVVTAMGWRLLNQGDDPEDRQAVVATDRRPSAPDAFYPLTMPLTVGPGSMTVAITLGSQRPQVMVSLGHLATIGGGAVAGLLAIGATIYVCYRFAETLESFLGPAGINVLVRLSAFILLCIGIEIAWAGVSDLVSSLRA